MDWRVHLYWILGWIAVGFGVPEAWALVHKRVANTFSNSVWVWLGTWTHDKHRWVRFLIFNIFWQVLGAHFDVGLGGRWLILASIPITGLVIWSTFVRKER